MTRQEMKQATIGELLVDYVDTSNLFVLRLNSSGKITALRKHLTDLEDELLKRGVLTAEQIEHLNA